MCSAGRLADPLGGKGRPGRPVSPGRASGRPGDHAPARSWLVTWILAHLTGKIDDLPKSVLHWWYEPFSVVTSCDVFDGIRLMVLLIQFRRALVLLAGFVMNLFQLRIDWIASRRREVFVIKYKFFLIIAIGFISYLTLSGMISRLKNI